MADWKDILSDDDKPLSEEEMLRYLDETASGQVNHAINDIAADSFESDALEGLQKIKNSEHVTEHVNQLKKKLHQQLKNKKQKKQRHQSKELQWALFALILLLLICVIGYIIIKLKY
jgi:hypothetical protein